MICPVCKHNTFINEFGDIQCEFCRRILPFSYHVHVTENIDAFTNINNVEPTPDMVSVVRYKDCHKRYKQCFDKILEDDDFCSRGEKGEQ